MDNTRESDLELLELARDKADTEGREDRRNAVLEGVWQQSKDPKLTQIRNELAKWINFGLEHVPTDGMPPTYEQSKAMAEAEMNIERLEKVAQAYVRSPGFQTEMLKRMAKHDSIITDSIVTKQKRRFS
jgi:hypothetical protein